MADERYKSVSTFALPDAYQQQAAEARRRRRMAEMLAQQAYQPGDIQNAPIPAAAPLVQGLQAYLAARAGRKADEAEESARETASREARQLFRALTEEGDTTTNAVQPAMTPMAKTVTAPQFEDGRITAPASIEMGAPPPMTAPETQLSRYNLTPGQRRAAALEGMLTSENPMLQKVAGAIYPTLQPEKAKLQTAAVNLKDLTPASARRFAVSGDPKDIEYAVEPTSTSGLTTLSKLYAERNALIAKNPNDPFIKTLDSAIAKEITPARGATVNVTNRYGAPMPAVDAQGKPVFIQPSQTGGPPSVLSGFSPPSAKETPPTVSEATSGWNVGRIINAANAIQSAIEKDPSAIKPSTKEFAAGMLNDEAANAVRSPQRQIVVGEQSDMLDAFLTLATGAAYTDQQFINAKRGLTPTLTDDDAAIKRKSQKLLELIPQAKARTGAAWTPELEKAVRDLASSFEKSSSPSKVNPASGWGRAQQVK